MEHNYTTTMNKVTLRPLVHEDLELLREWRNDSTNSKFIRKLPQITPEGQDTWYNRELSDNTSITFAIDFNEDFSGSVSLYDIDAVKCKFGRLMVGKNKGCGIGYEASYLACYFAFTQLGINLIRAEVSVDNLAALKIYVRLGFEIKGRAYNSDAEMDEFLIELNKKRFESLF